MLDLIFPRQFDNNFRGQKPAIWLFAMVVVVKALIGLRSIFDTYAVARDADGIPLDSFPPAAAQEVVSIFALLGLSHVMMALVSLVALVRYRAMIPLLFVVLLLDRLARQGIVDRLPHAPVLPGAPGWIVATSLLTAIVLGLGLSLWQRRETSAG